jgi:hypothetical protein
MLEGHLWHLNWKTDWLVNYCNSTVKTYDHNDCDRFFINFSYGNKYQVGGLIPVFGGIVFG